MTHTDLIDRLREDVLYGDERLHNMAKHNPLHLEAADALAAALEENERLRTALNEMLAEAWDEGRLSSALDRNPYRKATT